MDRPGSLFVLEGPDGVGKTTLCGHLSEKLASHGVDYLSVAFPGNRPGTIGRLVHRIHHDPNAYEIEKPTPAALQLLHLAAHTDAIETLILPALNAGRVVVLDRYWWSTEVYGLASGLAESSINALIRLERHFWGRVKPRVAFLLTRKLPRGGPLSHAALNKLYAELVERERRRHPIHIVKNDSEIEQTVRVIWDAIARLRSSPLKNRSKPQLTLWKKDLFPPRPPTTKALAQPPPLTTSGLTVIARMSPLRPSEVYDTYWRFAAKRQDVFFNRLLGRDPPWTKDTILQRHKFTNVYRACDRVSQFLIRDVIRKGSQDTNEIFFRIILFKIFNRIETWRYLESELGNIRWADYRFGRIDAALSRAMSRGMKIYSAAYIMPSARLFGHERKHSNHLKLIEQMMKNGLPVRIRDAKSMNDAFLLIRQYHSIGDFLAYQYVTDINYSDLTNFSESEFVCAGPGARDGIRKCFLPAHSWSDADVIKKMAELQEAEFERLGILFQSLWGRRLQYIDCQNIFCEVDKYARVAHPKVQGESGRTRIKQVFRPQTERISYIFPKKWELDELVPKVPGRTEEEACQGSLFP